MSQNEYYRPITLENVRVLFSNLDRPDSLNKDTHNVTIVVSDEDLVTLEAAANGRKINGLRMQDKEPNAGVRSLKLKSRQAIKDGLTFFPRGYSEACNGNESIFSTDIVSVQITPCDINGGPAANSHSFYLKAIRLEQVGTRDWMTDTDSSWGQDDASIEAFKASATPPAPANVPSVDDDDIPF